MDNIEIVEVEVFVMFGDEYVDGVKTGERGFFKVRDIYKIVSHPAKKNYYIPLFYTRTGVFSSPVTLESCKNALEEFGILQLDSTNLVNLNNIVDLDKYHSKVIFDNGLDASISSGNKKLVEDFLSKKD